MRKIILEKTSHLTFEQLPHAVEEIQLSVFYIKEILENLIYSSSDEHKWFNLSELCNYLPNKPSKATIYGYVSKNLIPYHKSTKNLRFLKSEIDAYLKEGKKKTASDIEAEGDQFLSSLKRKEVRHA